MWPQRPGGAAQALAMNYRFSNLLGAPYRGGTLLIHDNELLTPVGNRVGQVSWKVGTAAAAGCAVG